MKFWAVLKWMLILTLAIVFAAGVGGVWLWKNGNSVIRQKLLATFDKGAPDLELRLEHIEMLGTSSIKLTGVEVRDRSTSRTVLRAAELQVSVDEAQLVEQQQILLRTVKVSGIDILLRRFPDGRWNWQGYRFQPISDAPFIPPSITLENLRARVMLEHNGDIPPASLLVSSPQFLAIPSSGTEYDFSGLLTMPGAGDLALTGDCDLEQKTWSLGGTLNNVSADQSLLEMAKSTAPQLAEQLQRLDTSMAQVLPRPTAAQTASSSQDTAAIVIGASGVSPRFLGVLDVDFKVEKRSDQSVPDLRLKVDIRDGQLRSSVVPIQLTDVRAKFFWSNSDVVFQLLNARDGDALITGEMLMPLGADAEAPVARLHLENLPVSPELKPLVPQKSQKFFDHFQPVGMISGDVELKRNAAGKWLPVSVTGKAVDASILFHKFRYPVTGISASLRQRTNSEPAASLSEIVFEVNAEGKLGPQTVFASGYLKNPGPEIEMEFNVHVDELPIDSRLRDALEEQGRKVVDTINITSGLISADVNCTRAPGLDQPTHIVMSSHVSDAKMQFRNFPYAIDRLSGQVDFHSREKSWTFRDLHGWHGPGELTGAGTFRGLPTPGQLQMSISAKNARLDGDLFNSLNESCRSIWTMLNPEGNINLTTKIDWTAAPGQKPVVSLSEVTIFDAAIYPRPFPFRMNVRSATLSYDPNDPKWAGMQHCEIHSLNAEHDGARITASGWAEVGIDGLWQLHLNDLNAIELKPDDSLRAALPTGWRETLSRLSPNGMISVESSELEFRGINNNQAPITAAWDTTLRLKECEVAAGLDLKKVSGIVRAAGSWDGYQLQNRGTIRLDKVEVLDMTIAGINGPYTMTEEELVLGNRDVIQGRVRPRDVPAQERIQAQAYGGSLEMDGLIKLRAGSNYRFFAELRNALLESYAARHMPSQSNMKGVVNSWVFVTGDGDSSSNLRGNGQLQINPAALYEVPVVLEMLSALNKLNFAVPNRAAFDYALMSFKIEDSAFQFDPIDLVGDALALRGRGSVGFGGDVVLDFFSRPTRPKGLPLSGILPSLATQWVNVKVRGTIDKPQTDVKNRIKLDESMRQFLGAQPRPGGPIPGLTIPTLFGQPPGPQVRRAQ